MKIVSKFNWNTWRNKWVWYGTKKIKLRQYIKINAELMQQINKKGWHNKDHITNYKIALCRYGLPGIKHYEERFYKDKPMPYNRSVWENLKYWLSDKINLIKSKIKNNG